LNHRICDMALLLLSTRQQLHPSLSVFDHLKAAGNTTRTAEMWQTQTDLTCSCTRHRSSSQSDSIYSHTHLFLHLLWSRSYRKQHQKANRWVQWPLLFKNFVVKAQSHLTRFHRRTAVWTRHCLLPFPSLATS
jgi:hypothetical protein